MKRWCAGLSSLLVLAACSRQADPLADIQKGQIVGGATKQIANVQPVGGFLPNPELLQPGDPQQPDLVYVRPAGGQPGYNRIMLESVTVWSGPTSTFANLTPTQRQALANKFTSDIRQALSRHCSLTTRAAPGTIALRFALVDASAPNPVLNTFATFTPYVSSAYDAASLLLNKGVGYFAGTATVEGYASDAISGALIWEAVDKRGGTTSFAENTLNTNLDIDHAFKAWSQQLASRLVQAGVCGA